MRSGGVHGHCGEHVGILLSALLLLALATLLFNLLELLRNGREFGCENRTRALLGERLRAPST